MNTILFHDAQATARELAQRLRVVLDQLEPAKVDHLVRQLDIEVHDRPLLVFTGQYSSGKSTLIKALTDSSADVRIDSDISTDSIDEFDWDGLVRLVDTPGVQAETAHDALAEDALRAADLVLFTVTVELFDDPLIQHLQHVLTELGKADQTVIVMTKASTREPAPEIRDAAVQDALGAFAGQVPWTLCDAQNYLTGLDRRQGDPARADRYIAASGLDRVRSFINDVARRRGDLARFSQPLQRIEQIAGEADGALSDDPTEASALIVLARQRSALSERRVRIDGELGRNRADFQSIAIRAAETFADLFDQVPEGTELSTEVLGEAMMSLNGRLDAAAERFHSDVVTTLERQFDGLTSEVREIEASPHAKVLVEVLSPAVETPEAAGLSMPRQQGGVRKPPAWAGDVSEYLKQFGQAWGAGNGMKDAAGSAGHQIVYKVGKFANVKFKPWGAVKVANNIGKAAKVGGVVISLGLAAYTVFAEEREAIRTQGARNARRRSIMTEVRMQSDVIADGALREVRTALDEEFDTALAQVDVVVDEIHAGRTARRELARELHDIRSRARAALAEIRHEQPTGTNTLGRGPR